MSEGGLYAFQIRAREILEDETGFGDEVTTNVTLVITDVDDRIPTFNRNNYTVAVPEDVGELARASRAGEHLCVTSYIEDNYPTALLLGL